MSKTTAENTKINSYYISLTNCYIKSILNSGLLLDEDLEVLLNFFKPNQATQYKYKPSFKLPASILGLLGSIVLAKQFDSKLMLAPPFVMASLSITSEILDFKCRKKQQRIVDDLIDILIKISKINAQISAYVKSRKEMKADEASQHAKKVGKFLETIAAIQLEQFESTVKVLEDLGSASKFLTDDLECLKCINLSSGSPPGNFDIETCLNQCKRAQDIHIWLTSKLLSYFGVVFSTTSEQHVKQLLDTLPRLLSSMTRRYEATKNHFHQLRDSVERWAEYKTQRKQSTRRVISAKLDSAVTSVVDNLSLISEKSLVVFNQLDSSSEDPKELNTSLLELRHQTHATLESLDLLCTLYGILTTPKDLGSKLEASSKPAEARESGNAVPCARYDDQMDAVEEQYDLFIGKDDAEEPDSPRGYSSGAFVGLMLEELKQALQQHERFVRAKQRRGSVEEERNVGVKEVVPMFDMKALEFEGNESVGKAAGEVAVPPVPPPLPSKLFDLSQVEENGSFGLNNKSMMENIKILSGQLNGNEEVFGSN